MAKKVTRKSTKTSTKKKGNNPSNLKWWLFGVGIIILFVFSAKVYQYFNVSERQGIIDKIPKGFVSVGLDVSHHQGDIDWKALFKEHHYDTIIDYVYCKATEGETFVDKKFKRNRNELSELKVLSGAYHFFLPDKDPIKQAKHFLKTYELGNYDIKPMVDIELQGENDREFVQRIAKYLNCIEHELGLRPLIYTSKSLYSNLLKKAFPSDTFWIAAYSSKPDEIDDDQVVSWQFSKSFVFDPIDEKFDISVSKEVFR